LAGSQLELVRIAGEEIVTSLTGIARATAWELLEDSVKMAEYEVDWLKQFSTLPGQKLADTLVTQWDKNGFTSVNDVLNPMTRVLENGYMADQAYSSNNLVEYGYFSTHFGVAAMDTIMVADGVAVSSLEPPRWPEASYRCKHQAQPKSASAHTRRGQSRQAVPTEPPRPSGRRCRANAATPATRGTTERQLDCQSAITNHRPLSNP
jgi:hypothetical protein